MRSRRRLVLYILYLLLCAELSVKALLLMPWVRARLPSDVELGLRVRWVARYLFTDRTIAYGFDDYDPTKGWTLRPMLRGQRFAGSTVSSNSRGARGLAEHEPGRAPGRRRIVALGDSFTFGEGVNDDETWPARLQPLLGAGAEVVNLGVHGYGHDQMLIRLREDGPRYAPDLVLLGFLLGDAPRNLFSFRDYAKPRFVLKNGGLELTHSPVPPPARMVLREAFRLHLPEVLALPFRRYRWPARPPEQDALMAALLDAMAGEAARGGARFAIVHLPPIEEIPSPEPETRTESALREYAAPRGLPVCHTRAELAPTGVGHGVGGHYDAAQNAAVARAVARCLSEAGLLPPAPAPTPPAR